MVYICSKCLQYVGSVSEYGYGPIVPCDIYVGENVVGTITVDEKDLKYYLNFKGQSIKLEKGYDNLGCYTEAANIVIKELQKK